MHLDYPFIWRGAVLKEEVIVVEAGVDEILPVVLPVIQPHYRRNLRLHACAHARAPSMHHPCPALSRSKIHMDRRDVKTEMCAYSTRARCCCVDAHEHPEAHKCARVHMQTREHASFCLHGAC